jgi:hypothetical protein
MACHFNLLHFREQTPGNREEDARRLPTNLHKSAIIEGEKRYTCDILIYGRTSTF